MVPHSKHQHERIWAFFYPGTSSLFSETIIHHEPILNHEIGLIMVLSSPSIYSAAALLLVIFVALTDRLNEQA